ncbi:MAG: M36 family metallopeptidase [Saprospiraceae bacterium]|nr:M36 family metallopeptidase [Saprospiraceae bacterium]
MSGILPAQQLAQLEIARKHIQQHAVEWNLKTDDVKDLLISSEAVSEKGITYLYLNQAYNGIPVRNAMMSVIIKDGKVVSDAHNFVSDIASKINSKTAAITPDAAILKSASHLNISIKGKPVLQTRTDQGKLTFYFPEYTKSPIPAEQKYELVNDKLILVWNLNLDMKSSSDYWDINMDANTGEFVSKHNFTTYCAHRHGSYAHHDNCQIKTFRKISDKTQSMNAVLAGGAAAAQYNVYALPAESPNHGPRSIVTDAQFPQVSPYGWHDTNGADGAEYTTTRGNNVYAYQDKDDDDESDGTDTNGGPGLNFDYNMDLTKDPRESADASVSNLFYMVNMMHDVTATLGFTEEFGNFQQKNYTGKGDGGDYVLAQAFDGITLHEAKEDLDASGNPTKINNANFSTPNDGFNGTMQMFFWNNAGGSISIDEPESLKGYIADFGTGQFGKPIPNFNEPAVTGKLAVARDGSTNPTSCCANIVNTSEISGRIALIDRGLCDFSKKVYNVQQAGAIAAIICNVAGVNGGSGEEVIDMAGGQNASSVTIPAIFLKKSDCDKIRVVISSGVNVFMTFKEREKLGADYLDGSLDNGIIAHEFAHGISNRLTGGRLNSSCLNNDEQMGEGWSDFFSLVMTHEAGDKGTDVRGIGTFAQAQPTSGGGIRRYAYSTDLTKNPQTFDDAKGTTGPHALGEIWADVLWDMYWAFVDLYGYDPDWKNKNSGNHRAVFLVMEGMKMQACNPGFIAGRDAIFKADEIHNNKKHNCMLWNVFARRGLGYFADGGSSDDRNDNTENFEALPTCIEKLKISKTATTSINAGDEVTVTLKAINHIPSRQSNVIITDELPNGMTYVAGSSTITPVVSGNIITFEIGDMDYEREITITYKTKSSKDNKSVRMEFENFDGDFGWDIEKIEGVEDWLPTGDLYRSPDISFNIINAALDSDASLRSIPYNVTGNNPAMRFWHRYNTEAGNDGGFVEISVNNGTYIPVKNDKFIRNGYNGPLAYSTLAIPALEAFSGNSGGAWTGNLSGPWIDSYIDLSEYKGKSIVVRFRFGTNATLAAPGDLNGWFVDDFEILDIYKYTAQACISADGGQGEKACTQPVQTLVNSGGTVKADDVSQDAFTMQISPNPADDYVVITASAPVKTSTKVQIVNMNGSTVYQDEMILDKEVSYKTFNTSGLASGIYVVKIQNGLQSSTRKLIIK